ncbi:creatininase family protein [Amycolatopsis sp. GM8]|uniref:creatininase family protein n=1 Tax=Amycolatopsis sp. GM8 TaxID=2896530 RepID=UPI001F1D3FAE|nr:creatininase family protein [Amycolatopsis sp. GM8]
MNRTIAELAGPSLAHRIGRQSIVVLPTGALEHHGPHLPLGTDALLAEAVASAAIERAAAGGIDVWQLPTLTYTKSDEHSWAPGTVWLDAETLFRTVVHIGRSVELMGAGTLVFVNGHGGNVALLQVALREIRRRSGLKTFLMPSLVRADPPAGEGLDENGLGIHGGAAETSLVLHLRPELVDLSRAERWVPEHLASFQHIGFNGRPVSFGWLSDDFGTPGVIGDPTQATPAYGEVLWEASVRQAVESLREIARFEHSPTAGSGGS